LTAKLISPPMPALVAAVPSDLMWIVCSFANRDVMIWTMTMTAKMPTASPKKRFKKLRLPVHVNGAIVSTLP